MGDKGFQVPEENAPAYELAIQDPPDINERSGGGDNVHIGVLKYSINRLSKTTIAWISGVIAVLIVAGAVVLCILFTRPSQSSQPAMAMPTQSVRITVDDGSDFETKGLSHAPVMITSAPSSSPSTGTPSPSISTPTIKKGSSINSTGATSDGTTSAFYSSSTSPTSTSARSTSSTADTPQCTSGVVYSGSDLIHLNSDYGVYALEALAAVTDPDTMGDQDTVVATSNNTIFLCNGDWNLEALSYCSSGVTSGSTNAACAV